MFLGEYEYKVDAKGRVPLPPRFREELKAGLVIVRGLERCIMVYPLSEWLRIAEKMNAPFPYRSKTRRMNRFAFATAFSEEIDAQGRVALPSPLRQYAEIKETAVIIGVNRYLEVWSRENWEAESALMSEQAWQLSESREERE
jgi:MraZ protein